MAMLFRQHKHYKKIYSNAHKVVDDLQTAWNGSVYRCVELKWARPAYLISGEGTLKEGGRWLAPQISRVVHASSTELTAMKESRAGFKYYGITKPRHVPRVSVEISLNLVNTVNLSALIEKLPGSTVDELLLEDWRKINQRGQETLGQALGRALFSLGIQGVIAPSAVDKRTRSILWFPQNLDEKCNISISNKETLKKWLVD